MITSITKQQKPGMQNKLKQPTKYTHSSLTAHQQPSPQPQPQQQDQQQPLAKNKPIKKQRNKKQIHKLNEPSALRLAAINETFHKIEQNTQQMIQKFNVDRGLINQFLMYEGKVKCLCGRNIKYYCLKCGYVNEGLKFPVVNLPFWVRVLHHQSEKINKSSIAPMALISKQINLETFHSDSQPDQLLQDLQPSQTCILFPHKQSKKVAEQNFDQIKNIVILDCTWFQTDQLVSCLQKKGYNKFIRLEDYESLFWRYNHHSDKALSSGEALAYFLRQYEKCKGEDATKNDNIMFLYLLNLKIVQRNYRKEGEQKLVMSNKQDMKMLQKQQKQKSKKQ